ncbi:SIMPL domain-containing protein [Aliikangiella coralliicola]|uniref:SIMPL domain-containing protein n=1 Tax=Aliikangiella coralliicola TaxID=2592383 RepID=A0A545UFF8_9GAMM|nr:SIMPL domain-containing protein [Aliikangiella coralliicola]TQV88216.1 SIMPL domain-containing protein [Aliikangiella coralliicola]
MDNINAGSHRGWGLVLAGIFLALGIAIAGYFVGQTMFNAKVALNTAEAKGLAERRVVADRANWSVSFSVAGKKKADIPGLYQISEKHQQTIINLLNENGFDSEEIEIGVLNYGYQEFRDENQKLVDEKHYLEGSISVETNKVRLVAEVRAKVNKLIAQGIDIQNQAPTYRFTQLNEIKPAMLSEATKNARIAANEFASNAGVTVGGIRTARQGSFYIRDAGEDYGDTRKIEKDVRVVTNITFYLTD